MTRFFALVLASCALFVGLLATDASAAPPSPKPPVSPTVPGAPDDGTDNGVVNVNVGGTKPSTSITILIALTLLSVAPALLLMTTAFTKVFVVLSITRNALGLTNVPPNQVIAGLALFISLFIMAPTLSAMNKDGVQPYLKGEKTQSVAYHDGIKPLQDFMLKHTRKDEIALMTKVADKPQPKNRDDVPLSTLMPGVRPVRTARRLHHRVRHLRAVPRHRHGRLGCADVAGHDDAAPGFGVAAVQDAAVRTGQRVGPDRDLAGGQLPLGGPRMTDAQIIEIAIQSMTIAAKLGAPILLTALIVGFAVSLFQSVTQIQESTLSFVPKAIGIGVALLVSGNWMLHEMVAFTTQLYSEIPAFINGG